MRVMTLGGLPSSGFGAVAPILNQTPQPYFAASESYSLRGLGLLEQVPMPVQHLALGLGAFALGYWFRGRKTRR